MAACGRVLIVQKAAEGFKAFRSRCNCWGCSNCGPYRLRKVRAYATAGEPDMHLRLSSNPRVGSGPADRAKRMVASWKLLVKRIKYHTGLKALPFFYVIEAHKSGEPHMHILLRAPFIEQAWLSEQWEDITGASNVWVERIRNPKRCARYITKYITKGPERFGTMQRYSSSRDWLKRMKKKPRIDWKKAETRVLQNIDIAMLVVLLRQDGWTIIRAGPDGIEATPPHSGADPPLWSCAQELGAFPKRREKANWELEAA